MEFTYIFKGKTQRNTAKLFMENLGMDAEQIESILAQQQFELEQNVEKRKAAYNRESDPLFIESSFDGTPETQQKWRDKVNEIKARYPLENA